MPHRRCRHRSQPKFVHDLVAVSFIAVPLAAFSGSALGAFFQLAENNVSGLGNAFAGGAAIAEDASTAWYNPAGLTRLSGSQFLVGGHIVSPSLKFSKTSATTVLGSPISGGNGGDAGEAALIPNFYYSRPLNERLTFGVGVNAPYGLVTDYDDDWVGRYHADRSDVKTININPSLGYRFSDRFSGGFGVSVQYVEAELSQAVDLGTICAATQAPATCAALGLAPQQDDAKANVTADDVSYGYNFGLIWQPVSATRVGFAYRSALKHKLEGNTDVTTSDAGQATFAANPLLNIVDGGARADVTLPATVSLSVVQELGPGWTLMADITQTRWSQLQELRIKFDSGQADSVTTLNLENVYRYSLGATYAPGGNWVYRVGVALDQTPTPNAEVRTPRLPDEDRTWLALGAGYRPSTNFNVDFGYAYVMVDDARVNRTTGASPTGENFFRGNLIGDYEAKIHILSAQANWKF